MKSATSIVAVVLILLTGCATVRSRDPMGPEGDWEYVLRVQPRVGAVDLETGELRFRRRAIPTFFSELVVFGQRYEYHYRTERDPLQGYRLDATFEPPQISEAGPELTRRERNRGWYLAELEERRPGTPSGWIWVRRENLAAYLDPREIREVAAYYGLAEMAGRPGRVGAAPAPDRRSSVQFTVSIRQTLTP